MEDQQWMKKKRMWKPEEDQLLKTYVEMHGEGNWSAISKKLGLRRGGKSCRLRWKNYLRPDIKHGSMSNDEEDLIIRMNKLLGNRWALIAGRLPGRTDNEVKNYWNSYLSKKAWKCQTKRKILDPQITDQLDKNYEKRAKPESKDVGSSEQEVNKTHAKMVDVVEEDKLTNNVTHNNSNNNHDDVGKEVDDEMYWNSITAGELGSGAGSLSLSLGYGIMDMGFMDDGNQCMMFGGELDGQDLFDSVWTQLGGPGYTSSWHQL